MVNPGKHRKLQSNAKGVFFHVLFTLGYIYKSLRTVSAFTLILQVGAMGSLNAIQHRLQQVTISDFFPLQSYPTANIHWRGPTFSRVFFFF